jgi:hypothetical protein
VERLPIGMLFYIRDQEYLHQSSCEFPTHLWTKDPHWGRLLFVRNDLN